MNAQTEVAAEAASRNDLYYGVHKGIRLANARMLIALGQVDPADDEALVETLGRLAAHLDMSLSHLRHENHSIHRVVEARVPGGSSHQGDDHDHHLEAFAELRRMAEDVAAATHDRAPKLRRLYQRFALFVADDLQHMHEEETELMPLIEAQFTDAEIGAIHKDIVTNIPLPEMAEFGKSMLGAATRSERVAMVSGMAQGMPAEPFDWMMARIVGRPWALGDWDTLEKAVC